MGVEELHSGKKKKKRKRKAKGAGKKQVLKKRGKDTAQAPLWGKVAMSHRKKKGGGRNGPTLNFETKKMGGGKDTAQSTGKNNSKWTNNSLTTHRKRRYL